MTFQKYYQSLSKKYNLPSFKDLNKEFEISTIDQSSFSVRAIRRKMFEKLVLFSKITESILFPSTDTLSTMYESKFFTEEEKDKVSQTYIQIMIFARKFLKADVSPDEKTDVDLIKKLYKEWPKFKKEIEWIVDKMELCWEEKDTKFKDMLYFG